MIKDLHKKHIPTTWGVIILAILLVATVLLIPFLNQRQTTESQAAYMKTNEGGSYYHKRSTPTPVPSCNSATLNKANANCKARGGTGLKWNPNGDTCRGNPEILKNPYPYACGMICCNLPKNYGKQR